MPLAAIEPLFAPAEERERSGAIETLTALVHARIVFRDDLRAFGASLGFADDLLERWIATGLVHLASVITDAAEARTTEVLAPTLRGARELSAATGRAWKGLSSARFRRSGRKLVHDATVGQVALALLAARRDEALDLRGIETDDRALSSSAVVRDERDRPVRVPLQPDAYALVHDGASLRGLVIEVDRGTTSAMKLAEKFRAYAAWQRQGGPERTFGVKALRVVTLVPDLRRLERLRAVARESVGRPSGLFLFALSADVTPREPERLFAPIAHTLAATNEPLLSRR